MAVPASAHFAGSRRAITWRSRSISTRRRTATQAIQAIRRHLRDALKVATTTGYGPRFLHSTGQLHKGGADTGVFLQLTADDGEDLPIPG